MHALSHPIAVLLAAMLVVSLGEGCSLEASLPELEEAPLEPLPPLLAFAHPYDGLRYTEADDEDPDAEGIQLPVRVAVNDAAHGVSLESVEIVCAEAELVGFAPVEEDELGARYAVLDAMTFMPGAEGARFTLVARAAPQLAAARVVVTVVASR